MKYLLVSILSFSALAQVQRPLEVKVSSGLNTGVIYSEVPLSFDGHWLGSKYERSQRGPNAKFELKSKFGSLDLSHVVFKNPHYQEEGAPELHQNLTTVYVESPKFNLPIHLNKLNELRFIAQGKTLVLLNSNKNIGQGLRANDHCTVVTPYVAGDYQHEFFQNSAKIKMMLEGTIGISPLTGMHLGRNSGPQKLQETTAGFSFLVGVGTVMKVKDQQGKERWVMELKFENVEARSLIGKDVSLSNRLIAGEVDYRVSPKLGMGVSVENNQRILKKELTGTQDFEVYNTFNFHVKYRLAR